jgi:hypothetical protein
MSAPVMAMPDHGWTATFRYFVGFHYRASRCASPQRNFDLRHFAPLVSVMTEFSAPTAHAPMPGRT